MKVYICILALVLAVIFAACVMQSMAAHSFLKGYNQWINIVLAVLVVIDILDLKTQSPFSASVFVGFLATMSAGNIWDFLDRIHTKRQQIMFKAQMMMARQFNAQQDKKRDAKQ